MVDLHHLLSHKISAALAFLQACLDSSAPSLDFIKICCFYFVLLCCCFFLLFVSASLVFILQTVGFVFWCALLSCSCVSLLCSLSLSMRSPPLPLLLLHILSPAPGNNRWTNTCGNTCWWYGYAYSVINEHRLGEQKNLPYWGWPKLGTPSQNRIFPSPPRFHHH